MRRACVVVLSLWLCGCPESKPGGTALSAVTIDGLPSDAVLLRTVDEPLTLELHVLRPDGTPAQPNEYAFNRAPEKAQSEPIVNDTADFTLRIEHVDPNVERMTMTPKRPTVPLQLPCDYTLLDPSCEGRCARGTFHCGPTPWVTFWGGPVANIEVAHSQLALTVGEARPVGAIGRTSTFGATSHHPLQFSLADPSVAAVSADGVVTAKKAGTTTLTVSADGKQRSLDVVVTDDGSPGLPQARHVRTSRDAVTPKAELLAPQTTFLMLDHVSRTPDGAPELGVALASQFLAGAWLARWTGTGFGLRAVSPPWHGTGGYSEPPTLTRDERQQLYLVEGVDGWDWLLRRQPSGSGGFIDVRLPRYGAPLLEHAPAITVAGLTLTSAGRNEPRYLPVGARVSLLPRSGGGVWALWRNHNAYRSGELLKDLNTFVCVETLRLAEVRPDDTVTVEDVAWSRYVIPVDPSNDPSAQADAEAFCFDSTAFSGLRDSDLDGKAQRLLRQRPGQPKPDVLINEGDFGMGAPLVPLDGSGVPRPGQQGPFYDSRSPADGEGALLTWDGTRWGYAASPVSAVTATFIAGAVKEVAPMPPGRQVMKWAPRSALPSPPWLVQLVPSPGPYERLVDTSALAVWPIADTRTALRLSKWLDDFEVQDFPSHPALETEPESVGKRLVSVRDPTLSPTFRRAPAVTADGRRFVVDWEGTVFTSPGAGASARYTAVGRAPAVTPPLPMLPATTLGVVDPVLRSLGNEVVSFATLGAGAATQVSVGRSQDGVQWTWSPTLSTPAVHAFGAVLPSGAALVIAQAQDSPPALDVGRVFFSSDVRSQPFVAQPGLPDAQVLAGVRIAAVPRGVAVIATDSGELALLANTEPLGLLVRRVKSDGAVHDERFTRFNPAPVPASTSLDFVDVEGARIVGDVLHAVWLRHGSGWTPFPFTLDLTTGATTFGAALADTPEGIGPSLQQDPGYTVPMMARQTALPTVLWKTAAGYALVLSAPHPSGKLALAIRTSADGLTFAAPTWLAPERGYRQRLVGWTADADGTPLLYVGDSQSLAGDVTPLDVFALKPTLP